MRLKLMSLLEEKATKQSTRHGKGTSHRTGVLLLISASALITTGLVTGLSSLRKPTARKVRCKHFGILQLTLNRAAIPFLPFDSTHLRHCRVLRSRNTRHGPLAMALLSLRVNLVL